MLWTILTPATASEVGDLASRGLGSVSERQLRGWIWSRVEFGAGGQALPNQI
jgi:hypothetical protein